MQKDKKKDCCVSLRMLEYDVDVNKEMVIHQILVQDLREKDLCSLVPHAMSDNQKHAPMYCDK